MEQIQVDVVVIGSGPGGYVAAIRAGQLGKKVVCVEKDAPGGVCLNVGCIPSKALINAAKYYDKIKHIAPMGISVPHESVRLDPKQLQTWKRGIVQKLSQGVEQLIRGAGGQLLRGVAKVIGPQLVEVQTAGGVQRIATQHIIVATGSRPIEVPGFVVDQEQVVNSTGALAFEQVPKTLVVIGGGYIGLELGMMWAKLGSQVSVVEYTDQLLPGTDPELVDVVAKAANRLGMQLFLGHKALRFDKGKRGQPGTVVIAHRESGEEKTISCERVLCAVGRSPNSQGLGLAELGVQIDAKGFIQVDENMRTGVPSIYAIGDVVGQPMLAHKASREGEIAAEHIAGHKRKMDPVSIPAVIFTDPEIGSVGLTQAQATQQGYAVVVGKYPFSHLGRAMASLETDGFVKVVADRVTKQVLGVHVVGPAATDLISEGAFALEMGALLPDLGWTIHPHPTLGEALMEAAKAALGESPHLPKGGVR